MESLFDQIKGHLLESPEAGKYGTIESFKAGFPVVYGSADYPETLDENGNIVVQQLPDGSRSLVDVDLETKALTMLKSLTNPDLK
ncbi:hypothetical protein [Geofilum rhodophaeum]|uniref:hypothetical protein n=1 Tax=Geofilum rhodophaeum TaxID=1965019 RepID=UPI000B51E6FC|nr:hypothetical protein [Geofilum rhodophaeum]